jgi:hypothetical protein
VNAGLVLVKSGAAAVFTLPLIAGRGYAVSKYRAVSELGAEL